MAIERTDSRGEGLRPGVFTFTVSEVPTKRKWPTSGKIYYDFKLTAIQDGRLVEHNEKVNTWQAGPILRALGAKEVETGVFEWDKDAVLGLEFEAEVYLEKDRNDPTKEYRRLRNHRAVGLQSSTSNDQIPF